MGMKDGARLVCASFLDHLQTSFLLLAGTSIPNVDPLSKSNDTEC